MTDITIKIIGKTADTGNDVFEVRTKNNSFMQGCVHKKGINIWAVFSRYPGDFKKMMNAVVKKFNKNNICFTMVINDNLKRKLKGFKEKKIYWEIANDRMTILVGKWKC